MFKKKNAVGITEQELGIQAQKLYKAKIEKASKEVGAILKKYGLTLKVTHGIELRQTR